MYLTIIEVKKATDGKFPALVASVDELKRYNATVTVEGRGNMTASHRHRQAVAAN